MREREREREREGEGERCRSEGSDVWGGREVKHEKGEEVQEESDGGRERVLRREERIRSKSRGTGRELKTKSLVYILGSNKEVQTLLNYFSNKLIITALLNCPTVLILAES